MSNRWAYVILGAAWIWFQLASTSGVCPQGYYGLGCHYTCHCPPANCDASTGCSGNCNKGWSGPICTQENIALGKATFQSSYYPTHWINSSHAVDGNLTQGLYASNCILTATTELFTWWTVDLGRYYYIHELVIHFRTDSKVRRNGVEVYASSQNNSLTNGHLCGTAYLNSPNNTRMICDQIARYITLYQATYNDGDTAMDFCEVEVYVCQRTYGQDCSLRCSDRNCKDGNAACDHVTGSCGGRCQAGWHGDTCTNVCQGKYGQDCSLRCSDRNCKDGNAACDHVTGSCGGRCQAGWHGDTCTNVCQWKYGQDCSLRCSDRNCKDGNAACDHVTGSCDGRCQAGWQGDTCTNMCNGTYGHNCSLRCSDRHCKYDNAACDHVTGSCGGRCQAGWQGGTCTDVCNGTYGHSCSLRCSDRHCKYDNAACDHVTGSCGGRCQAGWQGDTCTHVCNGTYGQNCSLRCSDRHCKYDNAACDHVTGSCGGRCQAGWQGGTCTDGCNGTYGQNCSLRCSDRHCKYDNAACDHVTGSCGGRCQAGWQGGTCTDVCNGTYGHNCSLRCSDRHCKYDNAACDHVTGSCGGRCQAGWQGGTCTDAAGSHSDTPAAGSHSDNPAGLIGGGVGAAVVVLVVVIVVVVFFRRRQARRKNSTDDTHVVVHTAKSEERMNDSFDPNIYVNMVDPLVTDSIRESDEDDAVADVDDNEMEDDEEDDDTYYNDPRQSVVLVLLPEGFDVEKLENVIDRIRRQPGGFEAEFLKLPSGFMHPYTESQISQNRNKNRFAGYYPYDNNRVVLSKLPNIPHSDYINASYVDAYEKKNYFIASQAPNSETLTDFWRMIWEQDCRQIIMLTNLVEAGKHKCEPYWDDLASKNVGHFVVEVKQVSIRADYTIRKIQVKQKQSGKSKTLEHYHFTSWPDHGVPNVFDLLDFLWLTRDKSPPKQSHVLVHCSAGIGRTGTYIALHILTDEVNKTGRMNILQMMTQIRDQRKNMVQTKQQYECIFTTMLEVVKYGQTSVSTANYTRTYAELKESAVMGKQTINQLAQVIASFKTLGSPTVKRVWVDGKDSLFAVEAPSKMSKQGYLLVHTPKKTTENLLWKLLTEHDSLTLVTLGNQNDAELIPPPSQSSHHGNVTVTTMNQMSIMHEITLNMLRVEIKGSAEKKEIAHFSIQCWSNVADPSAVIGYMTTLTEKLLNRQTELKPHPVTVVFNESNTKKALSLCIMNNIMTELSCDWRVELFNNVRRFHTVLPNVHFTEEDFKLFCQFSYAHLECTGVYSNM